MNSKPDLSSSHEESILENDTQENESQLRYNILQMRYFIPNLMTILAVCAGVTGIRLAFENKFEHAIFMVLIAAVLDGLDGRIARMLGGDSPFGAQMDSLADVVNFGVAPALLLYSFLLDQAPRFGWIAILIYCIACCLRLARFNVMLEDKKIAKWKKNYFVGVPAPAGALLVLLPVYLGHLGVPTNPSSAVIGSFYTIIVAFLLVSRLPVWNGKKIDPKIRRHIAVPFFLLIVACVGFVSTYPWQTLAFAALAYLAFLPFSVILYCKKAKAMRNEV